MPQTRVSSGCITVGTMAPLSCCWPRPGRSFGWELIEELKGHLAIERDAPMALNGPVLWAFTKSSRLRFWFTVNQRCILSLSDFSFRLVFRYRRTVDLGAGYCLSVSFVASALVEWCLSQVHFKIAIFATRLKDDFCPDLCSSRVPPPITTSAGPPPIGGGTRFLDAWLLALLF